MCKRLNRLEIQDFSYLSSPIAAAIIAHKLEDYDQFVGIFIYYGDVYKLNELGYYNII